jgi:hypothetical protein
LVDEKKREQVFNPIIEKLGHKKRERGLPWFFVEGISGMRDN